MQPHPGNASAEKRAYFLWLAGQVSDLLPKERDSRNRFAMIVFSEGGKPQFVGRGNRIDAIRALRDMADRLERKEVAEMANLFPVADLADPSNVITASVPVPYQSNPAGWDFFVPKAGETKQGRSVS